jgi:acyl transferase domain-containing protein
VEEIVHFFVQGAGQAALPAEATSADSPPQAFPHAVAIVGMACRFPGGVDSPAAFWQLLASGRDAIGEVPASRWEIDAFYGDQPGQIVSRCGGFVDAVGQFDAPFFRIAPVEATSMDPQQRLLLETHWEALEDAGIVPAQLKGSATGIFVGLYADDYKLLQVKQQESLSLYFGTGTANSIAAGRVAYFLGTQGPALSVDTACSSSLVAVHLACQSLQAGECTLALASGVNLLLSELSVTFSQAGMLAPDGRCKTFDRGGRRLCAQRRVWGGGAQAAGRCAGGGRHRAGGDCRQRCQPGWRQQRADGPQRRRPGSAVSHGAGRRRAGAGADFLCGGTRHRHQTGDPIEVRALEAVYGVGRTADNPLVVGSVKTNIGHTEAAAGSPG